MLSIFNRQTSSQPPQLPKLDESLYPISVQAQVFATPSELLLAAVEGIEDNNSHDGLGFKEFSDLLQDNDVYQHWVNFTVFGRYIQRSFSAFYRQTEDVFNADMPDLLRHELMRHTQRLPKGQVLFCGSNIPASVRQEKLIISTLSPYVAIEQAHRTVNLVGHKQQEGCRSIIVNQFTVKSDNVKAFAIKHNKRTSERYRHEVMILDFKSLRLITEKKVNEQGVTTTNNLRKFPPVLLRFYDIS